MQTSTTKKLLHEFPSIATDETFNEVVVENRRPLMMSYMVFDVFKILEAKAKMFIMNVNHL